MEIKNLKDIVRKNLKEMAMDFETGDRPDPSIQRKLQVGDTPLKKVPMPQSGREPEQNFPEKLASERYAQIVQRVRRYTGLQPQQTVQNSQMMLVQLAMDAMGRIPQIEQPHKEDLENLAIEIVKKEMGIPEGAVQWDCKLEAPNMEGFQHDQPEQNPPEVQIPQANAELDDIAELNLERAKRRLINAVIQGSSAKGHYMYHTVENELRQITGNDNLINLYGVVMSVLDTQYWQFSDEMIQGMAGASLEGKEEVDRETDPPTIRARGTIFPILVHEIIKAVMELFSHHGEPENKELFQQVMELEDTLEKEIWDLRLGPPIWERVRSSFPVETITDENLYGMQSWILMEIFKLPATEFLVLTKEIMSESEEGRRLVQEIYNAVQRTLNGEDAEEETDIFERDLTNITDQTPTEDIVDFVNNVLKVPGDDASEAEWNAYLDQLSKQQKTGGQPPTPEQ